MKNKRLFIFFNLFTFYLNIIGTESPHINSKICQHKPTLKLIPAVKNKNLEKVKTLLNLGANCNYTEGQYQEPPLHIACRNGDVETAQLLLEHGAFIDAVDYNGETCLFKAVNVLKYSYNNTTLDKQTITQLNNDNERALLELLITHGINVNKLSNKNRFALENACFEGNLETVQLLVDNGALANMRCIGVTIPHLTANAFAIHLLCNAHPAPDLKQRQYKNNAIIATLLCTLFGYLTATSTHGLTTSASDWINNQQFFDPISLFMLLSEVPKLLHPALFRRH